MLQLLDQFTATAEGAWLLLLACVRRLPAQFDRAKRGEIGPNDSAYYRQYGWNGKPRSFWIQYEYSF